MRKASVRVQGFAAHAAELADLDALLKLLKASYEFDQIPFRLKKIRAALATLVKDPSLGRAWVIRDGAKAVGHAILTLGYDLELGGREATMTELFIIPEYRSRGWGSRMIRLIEETCLESGVGALDLQVGRDNVRAQSLYQRLGFRAHDRIPMTKMLGRPNIGRPLQTQDT